VWDVRALFAFETQRSEGVVDVRGQGAQPVGALACADPQGFGAPRRREGSERRQRRVEGGVLCADLPQSGADAAESFGFYVAQEL
jgi:hypothetical protein